ncbi:hypothetical protein [Microbacterium sp. gxy059]|uniref:hypothetical protein n=1 Tax=Microbacterium sp. gxy059 TaxID=2957199 RepID=UPI003D99F08A
MVKRRPRLRVTEYPGIVEGLRQQAAVHEAYEDVWTSVREQLETGDPALWWVTDAMSRLAHDYAPDLPPWTFEAVRPSPTGMLIWEGSAGSEIPERSHLTAMGLWWGAHCGDTIIVPLARATGPLARVPGVLAFGTPMLAPDEDDAGKLWTMFGTTLILAQTPTVGRHRPFTGRRVGPRAPAPATITQVTLRETPRHGSAREDKEDTAWTLTRQHLVRGHWKQQPYGPEQAQRKPIFVPPYVRGPEDGGIQKTTRVHVWRR